MTHLQSEALTTGVDLRVYLPIHDLQPQFAAYLGTPTRARGYPPYAGQHALIVEVAPGLAIERITDLALKAVPDVDPGIRYTGRQAGDPAGEMSLGEGTIINGSGVQTTTNSRWGDYSSMNVDPVNDCTFWYVNEYYTAAGQASATNGWQTRIASFKLPHC